MNGCDGLAVLRAMGARILQARLEALESAAQAKPAKSNLRAVAGEKLAQGANLTRPEVAAWFGVSPRCVQRWEAAGLLSRCPGLGTIVRYAPSDLLQIASAC